MGTVATVATTAAADSCPKMMVEAAAERIADDMDCRMKRTLCT